MIDILLATYNAEKYLTAQLDSIFAQKVDCDVRLIVSDDGSTDATIDILKQYRERITLVHYPHTKGAKGNFLSLLQATDSAYAAFCDQDDIWESNKLQLSLDEMRRQETNDAIPVLVHTDLAITNEQGKIKEASMFKHQGFDFDAITLNKLIVQNNATGCTMLMNRALVTQVRKADPDAVYMHDWWVALTAAALGKISILKEATVFYRQHAVNEIGASKSGLFKRAMGAYQIREKLKKRIEKTYEQASALLDCYGNEMTKEKSACLRFYMDIRNQNKLEKIRNLHRGAFEMQNSLQKMGHMLFV